MKMLSSILLNFIFVAIATVNGASMSFSYSQVRAKRSLAAPCSQCPENLFSASEKEEMLNYHNEARRMVQPQSSNMKQMMWDPDLADCDGQDYINQCIYAHAHADLTPYQNQGCTFDFAGQYVGQNLYVSCSTVNNRPSNLTGLALQSWFNENQFYNYATDTCDTNKVCGHYTQVAWANSFRLGCAYSACQGVSPCGAQFPYYWIVVCNYYPGGNYQGQSPYNSGTPCSNCPSNQYLANPCNNGLCVTETECEISGGCGGGATDECAAGTHNCDANADCTDTADGFTCACRAGYTGDGQTCTDINECTENTDNCHANAQCTNTNGGFSCACSSGYSGDGVTCTDINECTENTDNCHANAQCTNTDGGFSCACSSGYSGNGITCTDIDECAASGPSPCVANADCTNTVGSFTCACSAGYTGDGSSSCTDIDECAANTDNCDENAQCTNTVGSFTCACTSGYSGDGVTCT
ncbi:fibrillin-3, partial [Lingula anatina]|uniref:Fibrillin-3 n=1 Tax=Lingula anatina TaxID=7574 RepID=A0A1S3J3D6_LINAN